VSSVLVTALGPTAIAAQCKPPADGLSFLATFKRDAAAQDISSRSRVALDGLASDPKIISLDRRQGHFNQSFEQFAAARITLRRLSKGSSIMQL
jgi:membrane-bound lytic murein transglycosylase B